MTLSVSQILDEQVAFLRNSDIFTIAQRGVTTTTSTGTFAGDTSKIISVVNVKNVRSIVVASVTKTFGVDYTVDCQYNNAGTIACKITFTAAQTGAYTITYDYGTDKIYPDYPRDDLHITSYPRISVDVIGMDTQVTTLNGETLSTSVSLSITVYATDSDTVRTKIDAIRSAYVAAKKSFYYLKFITPINVGPLLVSPNRNDKVVQRTIDFMSPVNIEE